MSSTADLEDEGAVDDGENTPKLGSWPYSALKGEPPKAECRDELYQSSAKGSQRF
jgi:hypothetical protein